MFGDEKVDAPLHGINQNISIKYQYTIGEYSANSYGLKDVFFPKRFFSKNHLNLRLSILIDKKNYKNHFARGNCVTLSRFDQRFSKFRLGLSPD